MAEPLSIGSVVLRRADFPAEIEVALAADPRRAPHLAANPHLKAASWELVLDQQHKAAVVADLCDRHLDRDQVGELVDAREVRFGPLRALQRSNPGLLTEQQVTQLAERRMPSGSALGLANVDGLDTPIVDTLTESMSQRAALQFCAEHPKGRHASSTAAFGALLRRFDAKGAHGWVARGLEAALTFQFPAAATAAVEYAIAAQVSPDTGAGIAAAVAAHSRDVTLRARLRHLVLVSATRGADRALVAEACAYLIETGRLGGLDTTPDWTVALSAGVGQLVDARLRNRHGWHRRNRPGPPLELSLEVLPGSWAVVHASMNPNLHPATADQLAEAATTVVFAEVVSLPVAQATLDRLSAAAGRRYVMPPKALTRRAHKAPVVPVEVEGDVCDAPIDVVRAAVALDPTSEAADALAAAVVAKLGCDLAAWQVFLGLVDDTGTTVSDALDAAETLAAIGV